MSIFTTASLLDSCGCCTGRIWHARRAFLLAAAGAAALPAAAQVDVGKSSAMRQLVPAEQLETSATQQYDQMLAQAKAKRALAPDNHPQLIQLRAIAQRIIPYAQQWNSRAGSWRWEVNLIGSKQINAFCMPGGKIAFYTGILDQLKLTDDEIAMVMGHEMAHALREHARERIAKSQATSIGLSLGAQLLGLGELGNMAANLGTQLLTLKFSRSDESEADLVGLELAARAGYDPQAAVTLWQKMGQATGNGGIGFLSTHPTGPDRIRELEQNVPRVQGLYLQSRR
ncbi:MAG TPA: M48 family metallopeptidase [Alicycliphilus sp.]|jgi:Zn-dependent protease with chaperone function|nr:M48 family metallopeptidase [Alicycliphilus sp.]HRP21647.1 M48 family metallopeptidase [Alicycliphilus sp.]